MRARAREPTEALFLAPGDVRKARVEAISWMRTCDALAERGLRVTLASIRARYPDAVSFDEVWQHFGIPARFRIRALPTPLQRDSSDRAFRMWALTMTSVLAVFVLVRACLRHRGLLIYARSPVMLAPFAVLRRLLPSKIRPRVVYETHTLPPEPTWRIIRLADLVVVNSHRLEQDVTAIAGVRPERVLHAPLPPYADVRPLEKERAREELGLDRSSPIACYTGKMLDEQCAFLIETARLLRGRIPNFRMMLVGGNPDVLGRLERRIGADGLREAMILTGFVEPGRVGTYQSAADVLVFYMDSDLPHFGYCTPAKGLDYQAAGRPIVARDIPLFDEVFGADGERAIKVTDPTPEAFAEKIELALRLGADAKPMVLRAKSWIAQRTWQGRVDAVLEALAEPV